MENLEILALELGCDVGSLPTTYLGLPLEAKHNSQRVWDGKKERFRKRKTHAHPKYPFQRVDLSYIPFSFSIE